MGRVRCSMGQWSVREARPVVRAAPCAEGPDESESGAVIRVGEVVGSDMHLFTP